MSNKSLATICNNEIHKIVLMHLYLSRADIEEVLAQHNLSTAEQYKRGHINELLYNSLAIPKHVSL